MKKLLQVIVLTGLLSVFAVTAALAAPPPEKVDGFVCPVLGGQAGDGQGNSNPEVFIEIYDGDIIKCGSNKKEQKGAIPFIGKVTWVQDVCQSGWSIGAIGWYRDEIEIIGNINENPDLISQPQGGKK